MTLQLWGEAAVNGLGLLCPFASITSNMSISRSCSWVAMAVTIRVMLVALMHQRYYVSKLDAGLVIPIPPRRTGRASSSLSTLEHGGRPVRAGIRYS